MNQERTGKKFRSLESPIGRWILPKWIGGSYFQEAYLVKLIWSRSPKAFVPVTKTPKSSWQQSSMTLPKGITIFTTNKIVNILVFEIFILWWKCCSGEIFSRKYNQIPVWHNFISCISIFRCVRNSKRPLSLPEIIEAIQRNFGGYFGDLQPAQEFLSQLQVDAEMTQLDLISSKNLILRVRFFYRN